MSIGGIEQVDDMIGVLTLVENSQGEFVMAGTNAALVKVKQDVAAGLDPNTGQPWTQTKKGTPPLQNAADALSARIVGNVGLLILGGHYVFHFFGTGYLPKRRANLQGRLPARYGDAIRMGMAPVFEAVTKRGKIGTKRYNAWLAKKGRAA